MTGNTLAPVARLQDVRLRYGQVTALDGITLDIPAGCMAGLIGPDGVGKSSLLALVAGARIIQQGQVTTLGGDMRDASHRRAACPRIAYMPQGWAATCTRRCRWRRTCSSSPACSATMPPSAAAASTT